MSVEMKMKMKTDNGRSSILFESLLEQSGDAASSDEQHGGGDDHKSPRASTVIPIVTKAPSKCPLFCCFYSEFDIKKGPVVSFQSPKGFMDQDINVSTERIQEFLARTFQELADKGEAQPTGEREPAKRSETTASTTTTSKGDTENSATPTTAADPSPASTDAGDSASASASASLGRASHQHPSSNSLASDPDLHITDEPTSISSADHQRQRQPLESPSIPISSSQPPPPPPPPSIFDSTSEYIITGAELTSKNITLSTHSWHVMTRPTMISNARYERNALLFSVGFVLRRAADPSPFRPLLSKLAVTLQAMEEESRFLTSAQKRPKLQILLERVLLSLNSSEWECNLLMSRSNALHLKLYHPPKPETSPVHDHEVPILLRRDLQLQMYDWDLAINWVILHIDGVTNARQISIKAEVDLEMVRACLRVLKHHGVIALVSAFNYSNRYEFMPKATGALAGKEPKLLQEALDYVLKRNLAHSATPTQQQHNQQQQSSQAPASPNPSGILSTGSDGSVSHPTQNPVIGSPLSYFGFTPSSSSYPPRAGAAGLFSTSQRSTSNIRFAVMAAAGQQNSPSLEKEASAAMRGKNDDFRLFKSALAELYCACSRNLSFGDLFLVLTTNKTPISPAAAAAAAAAAANEASLPTGVDVPNIPPAGGNTNNNRHGSGGSGRHYNSYRRGSISEDFPEDAPRLQQQQQQHQQPYFPSATLESLALSPSESYHLDSLRRHAHQDRSSSQQGQQQGDNNSTTTTTHHPLVLDWKDLFQRIDHRRFVTFGLIHGLISRIHCFPCFPYSFPDPSPQVLLSYNNNHTTAPSTTDGTTGGAFDPGAVGGSATMTNNGSGGTGTAASAMGASGGGGGGTTNTTGTSLNSSSDILKDYQLAQTAALLMDGTRRDDELACAMAYPFKKLVELVETHGKHQVLLLYAKKTD